ncbi:MAG: type IX secretion system membrane protein PorP/SprF [Chitinophagaceae bacterium]|nr:MAG: type IX secretion system membrane protein PorP/SprF [Chitinophagaceae bacterium]
MKRVGACVLALCCAAGAIAQQRPHYTQYIMNQYVINPALSGIESYIDVRASHRRQWVGLEGAPLTTYVTIQGPIGKQDSRVSPTGVAREGVNPRGSEYWMNYSTPAPHHGVGVQILQDVTGPLSRSSIMGTYAYHLGLNPNLTLSGGIGVGMTKINLDISKLRFEQANDPSVYQNTISDQWKPDLSAGIYLYSSDFFAGISAQQVVPQTVAFGENTLRKEDGKLVPHLFATAGYRLLLGEDFNFTPSVMAKYLSPLPLQWEINGKLQYRDFLWVGASYRVQDGFAGMLGINVSNRFNVGYSYDYTTSALNAFTKGTHEFVVGLLLNNSYGDSCPRNVW